MNKIYCYLLILLAFTAASSCKKEKQETSRKDVHVSSIAAADTTENKIVVEEMKEKGPSLITSEQQISHMKESGKWEKYSNGILPQMSEDAPAYCRKILESDGKRFIIVDKAKMKLFLYDQYGNIEKSYGIACAKNYGTKQKKGDSRTTEGCFEVKGVFDSTNWLFTNDAGYTSPTRGVYGPRFIRLTIPYIGIHGTGSPGSIGRRCSHGCIRVTNANILELVKYVEEGMPVIISPGPADMAVNLREGSNILSVSTEPGSPKAVPGKDPGPQRTYVSTAPSSDTESSINEVIEENETVEVQAPAPEEDPSKEIKSNVKEATESTNEQ